MLPEDELAIAFTANPVVAWYFRNKCPQLNPWLDQVMLKAGELDRIDANTIRQAEIKVMQSMTDLLVYVCDPAIYDQQPFLNWDSNELLSLVDFTGKTVIDIGSGTGRLGLTVAAQAYGVFCVEPVANLRIYLKQKAKNRGLRNVYPVDGIMTDLPFPDQFADVVMAGHVFGDDLANEYQEMTRVTRPGGMIILCPGNNDWDNEVHHFLMDRGFQWSRFEEPVDGVKRKYWKTI